MKPSIATAIVFELLLLVTSGFVNGADYTQHVELRKGSATKVVTENIPDLPKIGFANPDEACVNGIWIFYQNINYNPDGIGQRKLYLSGSNACKEPYMDGDFSSMRYAGVQTDYRISSFTFYEFYYFQGRMHFSVTGSTKDLNTSVSGRSIIITGSDCWTVYSGKDYDGIAACVSPDFRDGSPTFIMVLEDRNYFIPEVIGSIKKGCSCDE